VATVGRTDELDAFLDSLAGQDHRAFRVLVVDQNDDDRVSGSLSRHGDLSIEVLRTTTGLSRARNAALPQLEADLVGFPDDDCRYPSSLLAEVAERFASHPGLDGLVGRTADATGRTPARSKSDRAVLADDNLWNRGSSAAMFLRSEVVRRVGGFDERLGVGSGYPSASAEEVDYLIRAVRSGARIEYDPSLLVLHELRVDDPAKGLRDGWSIGYVLRKHGYPKLVVARMLVRPLVGALLALAGLDGDLARFRLATLRGRVRGYLSTSRSNSSE
jgi:GT2 family glycosyltransferase